MPEIKCKEQIPFLPVSFCFGLLVASFSSVVGVSSCVVMIKGEGGKYEACAEFH